MAADSFTWTGFYAGGNAGVGIGGDSTFVDLEGFNYFADNPVPGEVTKVGSDAAFIGGAQIGYNQSFGRLVAGIEADISGFDFHAEKTPASSKQDWGSDTYVSVEMEWLATLRGRIGVAAGRWLLYGTAGIAFADGKFRNHDFCKTVPPCGGGLINATGDIDTGWAAGGGAEFAVKPNWTIRADYLFARFDGERFSGTAKYPPPRDPVSYRFSASAAEFDVIRVGLNYRFGGNKAVPESLK
jgi:outer membrane immunogenic protein